MTRARRTAPTVGIVGVGYMGIATGLAFAHHGRKVFAYDVNPRVRATLRASRSPYRELGLEPLLRTEVRAGRFVVVGDLAELSREAQVLFLCVPTPASASGRINLAPLRGAVKELGATLRGRRDFRLVVLKSTVVPGTADSVVEPLLRQASARGPDSLGVASNPEFLAEGRMVADALAPARVVFGVCDRRSERWLRQVYAGFGGPILTLSRPEAELVKYSSNAFLALKVSFANELSRWTERLGGNVDAVATAVGADPRIGPSFLRAGPGFGGSCFEKDLRAFAHRAGELGLAARAAEAALAINREQADHVVDLIRATAGDLAGSTVAVLGLAFKPGTDDVRESRAFPIVESLLRAGASVRVHDPVAQGNFEREWRQRFGESLPPPSSCSSVPAALRAADTAVLQADWPEYVRWNARWTRTMRRPLLVDLRRALTAAAPAGLTVVGLGVGPVASATPAARSGKRSRRRS